MKPPPFEYHRAFSAQEAVVTLAELGEDAKILAGGQSLTPMMNFRLARPSALVDINNVAELDYIRRDGDVLRVGALTRHRTIELATGPEITDGFAVLPKAARWIGTTRSGPAAPSAAASPTPTRRRSGACWPGCWTQSSWCSAPTAAGRFPQRNGFRGFSAPSAPPTSW